MCGWILGGLLMVGGFILLGPSFGPHDSASVFSAIRAILNGAAVALGSHAFLAAVLAIFDLADDARRQTEIQEDQRTALERITVNTAKPSEQTP